MSLCKNDITKVCIGCRCDECKNSQAYKQGRQDAYNEIAYSDNVSKEEFEKIAYQRGRENKQKEITGIMAEAELFHPYKVPGDHNTYSTYNEAWNDCLTFIDARLKGESNGTEND